MNKRVCGLLCAFSLVLALTACQTQPEQPPQSEPEIPAIEFIRTSIQVQPDNSYAIWEHTADNSRLRLSTYSAQGYLQYRIDYHYDAQGRVTMEQTVGLEQDGSTRTHTRTYDYSGAEVTIAVYDFGYEGANCKYTMSDPAHRVNTKGAGVQDGKAVDMTIEELDKDGNWAAEERIVIGE